MQPHLAAAASMGDKHTDPQPPTEKSQAQARKRREKLREERLAHNQQGADAHNMNVFFPGGDVSPPPSIHELPTVTSVQVHTPTHAPFHSQVHTPPRAPFHAVEQPTTAIATRLDPVTVTPRQPHVAAPRDTEAYGEVSPHRHYHQKTPHTPRVAATPRRVRVMVTPCRI